MFLSSKYPILFLFIFIATCHGEENKPENPEVTTPLGQIRGQIKLSAKGRQFSAFEGIPFAKPPTGPRRFKEPEPIEPWTGTWAATSLYQCPQPSLAIPHTFSGDEDCLYINVYVPREKINPEENLDVIVHIHGGAFLLGSGHHYSRPEYILDRDVIFVTFNYRLGILGFLSTLDDALPGNNGLKDQVMALKWMQENIKSFGGNPKSVTITGLSAGGASVHFHYFSPLSKGLFHRGFAQSGVVLNPWAIQEEPLKKAKALAVSLGCPDKNTKQLVECLRQRTVKQILPKISLFEGYSFLPIAFTPVLEANEKGAFITKNPYYLLIKGQAHDLPLLVSNTAHEGLFPGRFVKSDLENINAKWSEVLPFLLDYNYTSARTIFKETAAEIKTQYFGSADATVNSDNFLKFVEMLSDRGFLVDAETSVRTHAKYYKSPVYYYLFSYPGEAAQNPEKLVGHGEDGQYFFHKMYNVEDTENVVKMREMMLDMLESFAKTGKPKIGDLEFPATGHEELTYLNITGPNPGEIVVKKTKNLTPRKFWKQLGFLEGQNLVLTKEHDEL